MSIPESIQSDCIKNKNNKNKDMNTKTRKIHKSKKEFDDNIL